MAKQEEITRQLFKDAFVRILGQMEDIEEYNITDDADTLSISVRFKSGSCKRYYNASGVYSLEEMLSNTN